MQAKSIGAPRRSAWRAALDLLRGRTGQVQPPAVRQPADGEHDAWRLQLEQTLGAVDFRAHGEFFQRCLDGSEASLRFIG